MNRFSLHPWTARGVAALLILGLVGGGYGLVSPARAGSGDSSANPLSLAEPLTTFYPVPSTAYLINPGMGWQHAPGIGSQLLPETVLYASRSDISWRILNPGDGVYDWSALDRWISQAASQGKQLSFRVYTMRGESYGGHQMPAWVVSKGATVLPSGSPDYSNCVYQAEWARFVDALRARYDGNPSIAFIDISGYGDFNEWSWLDDQTVWENNALDPTTLDGQARKRLADMYIGGQDASHQCKSSTGATQTTSYSYPGFQTTQLVMPYAGTRQNNQYVTSRRTDVGIRYDCLGRLDSAASIMNKIGPQIAAVWPIAPIIYEMCSVTTEAAYMTEADTLLRASHGSIVHDNLDDPRDASQVERIMRMAGYRYQMSAISYAPSGQAGGGLAYEMHWQNVGYAPSYPKMGQRFTLHLALVNASGAMVTDQSLTTAIAGWMPASTLPGTPPDNVVSGSLAVPAGLPAGTYRLRVGIRDQRTGQPLNLAIQGGDAMGLYTAGTVQIGGTTSPTATVRPSATATLRPSATATTRPSATATTRPSATATLRPSATATLRPAATSTPWPTVTPWPTNTPTLTPWPTSTPWPTVTPWPTNTPTLTPWPTATLWPTVTPWPTNTPTFTPWPTATPWPTNTPPATPLPTQVPSATPWPTDVPPVAPTASPWPTEVPPNLPSATPWPTDVPPGQPTVPPAGPTAPPVEPPPQSPLVVHLADLDGFSDGSERQWTARVVIRVHDAQESAAAGVTVNGQWGQNQRVSCVTDGNGECTIIRDEIRRGKDQIVFTLLDLSVPGGSYNAAANHDPDGDWELSGRRENRIRIVISK